MRLKIFFDFIGIARRIWFRRNSVIHGGVFTNPNAIMAEVDVAMEEYTRIRVSLAAPQQRTRAGGNNSHLTWKAPPLGWYKANADVAIDRAARRYATGVVVRDAKGKCIATKCATQRGLVAPVAGEALALYHAACLGVELGGARMILEGDSIYTSD
jgi:hypothetical protein